MGGEEESYSAILHNFWTVLEMCGLLWSSSSKILFLFISPEHTTHSF